VALFLGPPGQAGARRNLPLDFYDATGDNKGRHTDNPTGRHSIWTNQRPTSISPPIFMRDALPAATLPLYPGLGQAPNMLACIPKLPSGVLCIPSGVPLK